MRRGPLLILALLGGVTVVAAACGGGSASPTSAGRSSAFAGSSSASRVAAGAAGAHAAPAQPANGAAPSLGADVAAAQPDVVETGTLDVRVPSATRVRSDATTIGAMAAGDGGYVQSSKVTAGAAAQAVMTVRIPDARLAAAVGAVSALGVVTVRSETGEDVTGEVVDLAAEQQNLQAEETAVRGILAKATKVSDILDIQQQLFSLQGQIRELAAQRGSLANQVAYASLVVTLSARAAARHHRAAGPGPLSRFWRLASHHTVDVVEGVVLAVGWAAPGLVAAAVAALGFGVLRRRRRSVPPRGPQAVPPPGP